MANRATGDWVVVRLGVAARRVVARMAVLRL